MENIITWSGWFFGFIGVITSIYFGFKSEIQKRRLQSVYWNEIHSATHYIARKIKKKGVPSAFIATDSRGGIISRLIEERFHIDAPIYTGYCIPLKEAGNKNKIDGFSQIETAKWFYYIPNKILEHKNTMIVLVEDAVFTGQTLSIIKNFLIEMGCKNVITCSILTSELSVKQHTNSDLFWKITDLTEITFPWGRVR
jgi:hypoxanthine phosphoribosyltransferase